MDTLLKITWVTAFIITSMVFVTIARADAPIKSGDTFIVSAPVKDCNTDIRKYCSDVTPGQNREVMCLLGYEDKISSHCLLGIYEAALSSEMGVKSLDLAYSACRSDISSHCSGVQAGEGRLVSCLKSNQASVSSQCTSTLQTTGFWNAEFAPASGE